VEMRIVCIAEVGLKFPVEVCGEKIRRACCELDMLSFVFLNLLCHSTFIQIFSLLIRTSSVFIISYNSFLAIISLFTVKS
jgi:hypothetical protein